MDLHFHQEISFPEKIPLWMFQKGNFELAPDELKKPEEEEKEKKEHRLYCVFCQHLITSLDHKIPIDGMNEHRFSNPHGFVFIIGCFGKADGCSTVGDITQEHTWFPGYSWRISLCGNCQTHLGWFFTGDGDSFYGLILNRLSAKKE